MEEARRRGKRRRVYSSGPNCAVTSAAFSHEYTSHLLPALLRAIDGGSNIDAAKKGETVRFEVGMALALSTPREFRWSRALRRELEEATAAERGSSFALGGHFGVLGTPPSIPRPMVLAGAKSREERRSVARGGEEVTCRIRALRRILPGGRGMGVLELLSEVESYVVCLQLQVGVLSSLVNSWCAVR